MPQLSSRAVPLIGRFGLCWLVILCRFYCFDDRGNVRCRVFVFRKIDPMVL